MTIERSFLHTQCQQAGEAGMLTCATKSSPSRVLWRVSFHTLCSLPPCRVEAKETNTSAPRAQGCVVMLMTRACYLYALAFGESSRLPQREMDPFGTFNLTTKGMPVTLSERKRRIKFRSVILFTNISRDAHCLAF